MKEEFDVTSREFRALPAAERLERLRKREQQSEEELDDPESPEKRAEGLRRHREWGRQ